MASNLRVYFQTSVSLSTMFTDLTSSVCTAVGSGGSNSIRVILAGAVCGSGPRHDLYRHVVELRQPFELTGETYAFTVIGPNGFRREFAGKRADRASGLQVHSTTKTDPRRIVLTVHNPGTAPVTFGFGPTGEQAGTESHTLGPGDEISVPWDTEAQYGWYDLTLSVTRGGEQVLLRRMAGHIENGKESVSG